MIFQPSASACLRRSARSALSCAAASGTGCSGEASTADMTGVPSVNALGLPVPRIAVALSGLLAFDDVQRESRGDVVDRSERIFLRVGFTARAGGRKKF